MKNFFKSVGKFGGKLERADRSIKASESAIKNLVDNFNTVDGVNDLKNELTKVKNLLEAARKDANKANLTDNEVTIISNKMTGYFDNIKGFEGEVNTALKLKNEGKAVVGFERKIKDPINPSLDYTDIDIITKEIIDGVEKEVLHQVKTGKASLKYRDGEKRGFGEQLEKTGEVAKSKTPKANVVFHYEKSPTPNSINEINKLKLDLAKDGVNLEIRSGVTYTNLNGK